MLKLRFLSSAYTQKYFCIKNYNNKYLFFLFFFLNATKLRLTQGHFFSLYIHMIIIFNAKIF